MSSAGQQRTELADSGKTTAFPGLLKGSLDLGATYQPSQVLAVDFAFTHVFVEDTGVTIERAFFDGTPLALSAHIDADVASTVNTI